MEIHGIHTLNSPLTVTTIKTNFYKNIDSFDKPNVSLKMNTIPRNSPFRGSTTANTKYNSFAKIIID